MAVMKCIMGSGGSSEPQTVTIVPNDSKISSSTLSGTKLGNSVTITGGFTVTSQIEVGNTVFTVVPAPSTAQTITNAISTTTSATRNLTVNTDGRVTVADMYMAAGYGWNANMTFTL